MKTFILTPPVLFSSVPVEIKVDAFCRNNDFLTPGFDVRFTNMEIVNNEDAIKLGVNLHQIESSFKGLSNLAESLGCGLTVVDLNAIEDDEGEVSILVTQEVQLTVQPYSEIQFDIPTSPDTIEQQFTISTIPTNAPKTVVWSIDGEPEGVTVTQNGLVTVTSDVEAGQHWLRAISTIDENTQGSCLLKFVVAEGA